VRIHPVLGSLILVALAGAAPAAAWGQGSLAACAQISDDAERLACYDQLAGRASSGAPSSLATSSAATAAAAAPSAANPVADFGLPPKVIQEREPEKWVDSVTAKVTNVGAAGMDRYVVTLDNGQVWMQSERNVSAILAPGDTVTIKRAALGSFKLSGPRSVYWRVQRVK
jgi:hypothetical protein